ncbi:diaminopimelate decarboxylase [Gulosibacter molinativorax]|nr:diaminopimelate decarboxylase [Gulosibacter molinativorax]
MIDSETWEVLPEFSTVDQFGMLHLGGCSAQDLIADFGSPLHVYDEAGLRAQAQRFVQGLRQRWPNSEVLFASKSFPVPAMYRLAQEEGVSIDVAGAGELLLAIRAGCDPSRIYFHGNAKTDEELELALEHRVSTIIVDNFDEISRLERLLTRPQQVLIRLIPDIDADTDAAIQTGGSTSKFGLPYDQALRAVARMEAHPMFDVVGVHVHIGSQIFNTAQLAEAVRKAAALGSFPIYNVGGGLGVKYALGQSAPGVEEYLDAITDEARQHLPADAKLIIEPGRSLVARSGVTLYQVVSVKHTGRHFVAIDGGLADQLDISVAGEPHEVIAANRMNDLAADVVDVVGRQCESGDVFARDARLPGMQIGDVVAYTGSGAYSYTTSNNYNGALRPAIVFVGAGHARLVTRRETFDELLALHLYEEGHPNE